MIRWVKTLLDERTVFLLDGWGALTSFLSTALLLPLFSDWLGIPLGVLSFLAAFPAIYLCFSFGCYFLASPPAPWMLKTVIFANGLYALVSAGFIVFLPSITGLGRAVLVFEILVLIGVIALEISVLKKLMNGVEKKAPGKMKTPWPRPVKAIVMGLILVIASLGSLRIFDELSDLREWNRLAAHPPSSPEVFDPQRVADLPEPARRYFQYAIAPGTPLYTVAEIEMEGQFSLGTKDHPNFQTMKASQILSVPHGFLWKLALPGLMPVSGSDSGEWTRFRIFGAGPVARLGGTPDHRRAAFARYVAEALFWTPAALLPGPGISWESAGPDSARVTFTHGDLTQTVHVEVDSEGKPLKVHFMRWSDANPEKKFQLQPFGGTLEDFRSVQGFKVPFNVEAGNMWGTPEYFPFYKARLQSVKFISKDSTRDY